MDFQDFLKWEETDRKAIRVKCSYIDIAGDLVAGVLLSQIIYWHLPSKQGNNTKLRVKKDGEMWLAKGREDWWDECRITARQFDRAINILIDKGIVEKKIYRFDGSPAVHIRLIPEGLMKHIKPITNAGQREMDISESVKSILTKGEYPPLQKCKNDINESVKTLTEITTEITTETTTEDKDLGPNGPVGKANAETSPVPYQEIADLYTQICTSLPTLRSISYRRKKHLRARWKQFNYNIAEFREVFQKVAASSFCQGQNDRGWRADFDWLIRNDHNMVKVLEGKYDDKQPRVVQVPKKRKEVDLNELYIKNHRKRWGDAAIY